MLAIKLNSSVFGLDVDIQRGLGAVLIGTVRTLESKILVYNLEMIVQITLLSICLGTY